MIWLSIDPGVRACGCALWHGETELARAAYVSTAEADKLPHAVEVMAGSVHMWVREHVGPRDRNIIDRLVIELPQTYRGMAAKGDTNDLIALAAMVGALHIHLGAPARYVTPHEWKGTIPKKTDDGTNVIEGRCREQLSDVELERVQLPRARSKAHNVWDAIGIGLWAQRKLFR